MRFRSPHFAVKRRRKNFAIVSPFEISNCLVGPCDTCGLLAEGWLSWGGCPARRWACPASTRGGKMHCWGWSLLIPHPARPSHEQVAIRTGPAKPQTKRGGELSPTHLWLDGGGGASGASNVISSSYQREAGCSHTPLVVVIWTITTCLDLCGGCSTTPGRYLTEGIYQGWWPRFRVWFRVWFRAVLFLVIIVRLFWPGCSLAVVGSAPLCFAIFDMRGCLDLCCSAYAPRGQLAEVVDEERGSIDRRVRRSEG